MRSNCGIRCLPEKDSSDNYEDERRYSEKERIDTCKADLQRSLECAPKMSKVAVRVGGFLLFLDRFFRGTWAQRAACKPVTAQEHGRYQK